MSYVKVWSEEHLNERAETKADRSVVGNLGDSSHEIRAQSIALEIYPWEFPKIRCILFWGPYNQDPNI